MTATTSEPGDIIFLPAARISTARVVVEAGWAKFPLAAAADALKILSAHDVFE